MSYQDIKTAARNLSAEFDKDELDENAVAYQTGYLCRLILDEPVTVFVVTITHDHGVDVIVNTSRSDAMDTVYRFAAENWEREMAEKRPDGTDEWGETFYMTYVPDMPIDKAAVVSEYFDRMEGVEYYDVTETTVGL